MDTRFDEGSARHETGDIAADHPWATAVRRAGVLSWSLIGLVVVAFGLLAGLAALGEIVLPLLLAATLGVLARPAVGRLQQHGWRPTLAASTVVLGMVVAVVTVIGIVVRTVVDQVSALSPLIDDALAGMAPHTDNVGLDAEALETIRQGVRSVAGMISRGLLTAVVDGVSATVGFIGGSVLGLLILYYLLKDGPGFRSRLVAAVPTRLRSETADFLTSSIRTVRAYWAGRSVMSIVVTAIVVGVSAVMGLPLLPTIAVVNFLGGFVPYIGAVVGGGLVTLIAVSHGGIGAGLIVLAVVIVANVVIENLIEPMIMGSRMSIHPLFVLLATTAGGMLGGMVGLMMAVPATAVALDLATRIRRLVSGPTRQPTEPATEASR